MAAHALTTNVVQFPALRAGPVSPVKASPEMALIMALMVAFEQKGGGDITEPMRRALRGLISDNPHSPHQPQLRGALAFLDGAIA